MPGYISDDKVHDFVERKISILKAQLGPKYNPETSGRLRAYFADSPTTNLETRFNEFLVAEYGSISLSQTNIRDLGEPTDGVSLYGVGNNGFSFKEKKHVYRTIEHKIDGNGNVQTSTQSISIDDANVLHFNIEDV